MTHVVRGCSYSDEDDESDDSHLPDIADFPQVDAQDAQPEVSAVVEAPFAEPLTTAASHDLQDVHNDASSSQR